MMNNILKTIIILNINIKPQCKFKINNNCHKKKTIITMKKNSTDL